MTASRTLIPEGRALTDMEEEIHGLERGAYNAVLKAFIAQSDDLSWVCVSLCMYLLLFCYIY